MPDSFVPQAASAVLAATCTALADREAEGIALACFGITGRVARLSSERDQTFLFIATDGRRLVLKIANPVERPDAVAFQLGAMRHLQFQAPDLPVPRVIPTLDDGLFAIARCSDGSRRIVQLLTYLEGEPLYRAMGGSRHARDLGRRLAEMELALATYRPAPPEGKLLWDLCHSLELREFAGFVDCSRRPEVLAILDDFERRVLPVLNQMPRQVIHNDFNPHNLLVDPTNPARIAGIIDFGDMVMAPRVNDLAVALSYQLACPGGLDAVNAFMSGYGRTIRPEAAEWAVLPDLVATRLAMTVIIGEWRASLRPDLKDYILRNHSSALVGLLRLPDLRQALARP